MNERIKRLIRLKVKLQNDFFNIHTMKRENLYKIERCDSLIKKIINSQLKN